MKKKNGIQYVKEENMEDFFKQMGFSSFGGSKKQQ